MVELPEITELDGTLKRGPSGWFWSDGTFEPRVRDLTLEELAPSWRCVRFAQHTWVEIPTDWRFRVGHAELRRAVSELVRDYSTIGAIRDDGASSVVGYRGQMRSGYRVPLRAWKLIMQQPIGATWDESDDEDIRAHARALGCHEPTDDGPLAT